MRALCIVRSATLAAVVPWSLDVMCPNEHERRGALSTDHAASSYGLPVVVVEGNAYGPADLGEHVLVVAGGYALTADDARRAGYTVQS